MPPPAPGEDGAGSRGQGTLAQVSAPALALAHVSLTRRSKTARAVRLS